MKTTFSLEDEKTRLTYTIETDLTPEELLADLKGKEGYSVLTKRCIEFVSLVELITARPKGEV